MTMFQLATQSDHIAYPVTVEFVDEKGKVNPKPSRRTSRA